MVGAQDIAAQLQATLDSAARAAGAETAQNYDALSQDLADLETVAKGAGAAHADCRTILAKLRSGAPLAAEDVASIRLLVIGDADYYVKYDEELDRAKAETAKIVGEIQRLQAGEMSADGLLHLSVLCREARSVLELVRRYFDAKERVSHFEAAIAGPLDQASTQALIEMIEDMTV